MASTSARCLWAPRAGLVAGDEPDSRLGGVRPTILPARQPGLPSLAGHRILIVDDEPMILEILADHCASLGMAVQEADDGEPALRTLARNPGIELLLTDVRMPVLDGPALVERALILRPLLKVIFITGYTTHHSTAWPTLRKPFDLDALDAALRRALLT